MPTFTPGDHLGPYEILCRIGAGGMGEVWKARDTRLGREVAIKVSAEKFNDRFEREGRAVATLNHPNICTLHDVGALPDGLGYLVMELIEGPTLAERIKPDRAKTGRTKATPLPLSDALAIAQQIAAALDAAHQKGIVHRDLKPANIKVSESGSVKVLDFGLALVAQGVAPALAGDLGVAPALAGDPNPSNSPTLTELTRPGMILGTAAYMSPEQARGKPVDKRADIWAFGVVLYEMVTGKSLFKGEDISDTLAAVLKHEPDLTAAPPEVRKLLQSCLEKDPNQRLRDIGDWRLLLSPSSPMRELGANRAKWLWPGVAAALAIGLASLAFLHFHEQTAELVPARSTILPPERTTLAQANGPTGGPTALALSPDGRRLAFVAVSDDGVARLWIRPLDSLTAHPLAGTEGAGVPFWSPDGAHLGFWAGGKLKKIDASGGPPITLCDAFDARGGTWNREGVIVFAPSHTTPLFRVAAAGGPCTPLTTLETTGGVAHRFPRFLPDGRHFLFAVSATPSAPDHVTIRTGSLDSPESKVVLEAESNAIYAQGHLLFIRETTLMAQPFDLQRLAVTGEAVPVAEQVRRANTSARGIFDASENGTIVYQADLDTGMRQLVWLDRSGKRLSTLGEPAVLGSLDLSPDRKTVAVEATDRGNTDIWLYDASSGKRSRFTFDAAKEHLPIWSPDGRTIVFGSDRKGHFDVYRRASDGSLAEELVYADDLDKQPISWFPDGKLLTYGAGSRLMVLPVTPEQPGAALKPSPIAGIQMSGAAKFSPDGQWIAYHSVETGRSEVYVRSFRGPGTPPGPKIQVSVAGGFRPRWRPDGKEIFFVTRFEKLMAVEVNVKGAALEFSEPRLLFGDVDWQGYSYDVSADGQRFLVAASICAEYRAASDPDSKLDCCAKEITHGVARRAGLLLRGKRSCRLPVKPHPSGWGSTPWTPSSSE